MRISVLSSDVCSFDLPCLTLPVAVNLKRFFTPLLVLSLGIFVSFISSTIADGHGSPLPAAQSLLPRGKAIHTLNHRVWLARRPRSRTPASISNTLPPWIWQRILHYHRRSNGLREA